MNRFLIVAAVFLTACSHDAAGIRIAHDGPAPAPVTAIPAHTEPVFFNGKTYSMALMPDGQGGYGIAVSGMSAGQGREAAELTKTAFHHFTCKDSQIVKLNSAPTYDSGKWNSHGRCA